MQVEALRINNSKKSSTKKSRDENINKTLKGVLINNYLNNNFNNSDISFDEIQDSLLIVDNPNYYNVLSAKKTEKESSFDINKAIKPLIFGTLLLLSGCIGLSAVLKKSSKALLSSKNFEQLPDLAVNMNIKEEPQFAIYRAIRDPNFKNILGAAAVFFMSGITLISKNFVDGFKEIWIKKQAADIEKDLQEGLIEVETNSFSGKLNIVNKTMKNNIKYFDEILNHKKEKEKTPDIFTKFLSFKGESDIKLNKNPDVEQSLNINSSRDKTNQKKKKKEDNLKNIKYISLITTVLIAAFAAGKISVSNLKKTAQFSEKFANDYVEKTINAIEQFSKKPDVKDISKITDLFKSICAKPEYIKEVCKKYKLQEEEIQKIINTVEETKKTIFADAPTALGGIPKKIQYYCYIDENRGHLYNWVLNSDNKFTKYVFLAFTLSGAIGYLFKQGLDAIKEVAVMKENAKTELDLRKRLVDVEIRNFASKKESAIKPLIEDFTRQLNSGTKTKEELKQLADNILYETKNGPPYVYT